MKTANTTKQQKRIQKALDAGKDFRRSLKKLSGDAMDVAQIEAMVARVTLDLHLLKKEASGLAGNAIGGTAASVDSASETAQPDSIVEASPKKKGTKRPVKTIATTVSNNGAPTGDIGDGSGETKSGVTDEPREGGSDEASVGDVPSRPPRGKTKRTK